MTTAAGQATGHQGQLLVTVIVPVFNGGSDLEKCLAGIAASTYPPIEIILVDDGSTDGMTQAVAARYGARMIRREQMQGPASARNLGAGEARGDIIFFTDADVRLDPAAISIAVQTLDADAGLCAVFGSYDDQPGHASFLSQYRNLFHHWVHQTGKAEAFTFWTGCGAIRREVLLQAGGFNVDYKRPSIEDIELGARLRASGNRIRLEKTMLGQHMKRWTFWNMLKTDIFHRGIPWMGLVLREGHAASDLNLNLSSRFATFLAGLFGLSLLVFPFAGQLAALWPALALLLAGAICAWLTNPSGKSSGSVFCTALAILLPAAAYGLAPNPWAAVPLAIILAMIWAQLPFYRYLVQKRSSAFAIAVVPMQVLFFLGCVVAVPFGIVLHLFNRPRCVKLISLTALAFVLLPARLAAAPGAAPGTAPGLGPSTMYSSVAQVHPQDAAIPATAESEAGDDVVFQLPQIIVEGKKPEVPPSLIVRKLDIEDFVATNSHTVGEALTYVPGVNVQYGGTSGDARAWVRGYRDRDVLVLFDGIPVASGFEGTIDLNEIAVQRVASIDVIKSAPSVIYGTNAVGGVISIVPAAGVSGSFLDGTLELGGDDERFAHASGGSGNGNVSFALSAQYQSADDYSLSDNYEPEVSQPEGDRINSDYERSSLFFQFDALESPLGHASFFYNLANAHKGLPIESDIDDPDYERLTESKRQTMGLSNQFGAIPLALKLYYNSYDSELTSYTDPDYSYIDDVESNEDYSYGGNLYSTLETSNTNTLILSTGAQTDVFTGAGQLEDGNKAELTTYTLAAEDEYWITQKLSLAAGGIFAYFDQTQLNQASSKFNPQIALGWQVTPRVSLHGSIAQRTRFPKLRELYRRRYGNPDLDPQTAVNSEVGVLFQYGRSWSTDLALFHSNIDGLIERADRRALYTNFEPVTIDGIETATSGWISDAFFTRLAYTYINATEDLPDGGSRQLRSRPKHTAIAELRYIFPAAVTVSLSGIYVSGLYDLDPDGLYTRLPGYFVATAKAIWEFSDHYEAYLALSNVGDADYMQRLGDPREGRRLMLGVNCGF